MGWGLTLCLCLDPPWFSYLFSFTQAYSRISNGNSCLFIIVINLIFMFSLDALTELGAFMRTEFLCISVLRVASGPRVKLASCKSALTPPVVYSADRSKAVVPVLVLFFVALWFILRGAFYFFMSYLVSFCSLCFSVLLALRLPRLGKRELILVLFERSICACLDLSVFSSFWCRGRAAVCDCGTPWKFLLPFFLFY